MDSATDSGEVVGTSAVVRGGGPGSGRKDQMKDSRPPSARRAIVARALAMAASTLRRLRTMPASAISRSTSAGPKAATTSASKPANASRKRGRLLRMVSHERPDWKASRVSRSRWALSPDTRIPHSVSW